MNSLKYRQSKIKINSKKAIKKVTKKDLNWLSKASGQPDPIIQRPWQSDTVPSG